MHCHCRAEASAIRSPTTWHCSCIGRALDPRSDQINERGRNQVITRLSSDAVYRPTGDVDADAHQVESGRPARLAKTAQMTPPGRLRYVNSTELQRQAIQPSIHATRQATGQALAGRMAENAVSQPGVAASSNHIGVPGRTRNPGMEEYCSRRLSRTAYPLRANKETGRARTAFSGTSAFRFPAPLE